MRDSGLADEAPRSPQSAATFPLPHESADAVTWRMTFRRIWPELLLGLVMGTAYLFVVPLWEAPDEPYHFANVAYVRKYGLYTMTHGWSELPQNMKAESSQPPLYYLVASTASYAFGSLGNVEFGAMEDVECWDGAWRFYNFGSTLLPRGLRALSLLFLLGCAALLGHACTLARPRDSHLAGTAVAMLWAVPQVLFVGTSISNDSMAMAAGALLLMLWMAERRSPSAGRCLAVGLVASATVVVKFSLLPLAAIGVVFAATLGSCRAPRRLVHAFLYALPAVIASIALAAVAPDLVARALHIVGSRIEVQSLKLRPMITLPLVWESYWARFGWMNVIVPSGIRMVFWSFSVALVMGLGTAIAKERAIRGSAAIALGLALASIGALIGDLPHSGQAQGRHLFPAIAAMSFLGALAVRAYLSPEAARSTVRIAGACATAYVLGIVMPAAYGEGPSDLILGEACCAGEQATPSLALGGGERQVFVSARHGLCRVGVVPGTHGLPVRGRIRMSLIDRATRNVVASRTFTGHEIRDGRYLFLDFPPIADSRDRQYILRVERVGEVRGSVRLFFSARDVCPGSARLTGGGDLRFATYHMPHDREDKEELNEE